MVSGFAANPGVYPAPPVSPAELLTMLETCMAAHNACVAAQAAAEQATADKNEVFGNLVDAMKSDLRYAENTVDYDDEKLKLIGWAGRHKPTPLAAPGQCRLLEIAKQGEGWLMLDWKAPADGGKPAAYEIQRRERTGGTWQSVATALTTEVNLVDQPRGKELEYQTIAVNKAGAGEPSNTVMLVL
ncbi:MAG: fibronectin type III domain-containing protein [Phycisphaerae bacterium]|nr:fibronectin type III domain-containing protein [Phycisphaerae bacterium]